MQHLNTFIFFKHPTFRALKVIIMVTLLGIPWGLCAQNSPKAFHFINPNDNRTSFSFDLIHNLIVVQARLNNSKPLTFILDTGVQANILTEIPPEDTMSLKVSKTYTVAGLGDGDPVEALHTWDNTIEMAELKAENQDVLVLTQNILFLSRTLGRPINGLIGYHFFEQHDIHIRFTREIIVVQRESRAKNRKGYIKIPMKLFNRKPYIPVTLELGDSSRHQEWMLLDLGASHPLSIYSFANTDLEQQGKYINALLGKGLNGDIYGRLSRINAVEVGPYRMENPIAAYPDSQAIYLKPSDTHAGSVGADLLRRFHAIISYPDSALYLKPNKFYKHSFTYNTSGLEVIVPYPGLPIFEVDYVRPGSPAEEAGVQRGDQIEWIEGKETRFMDVSEVNYRLRGQPGRTLHLDIKREGTIHRFKFRLEDAL